MFYCFQQTLMVQACILLQYIYIYIYIDMREQQMWITSYFLVLSI